MKLLLLSLFLLMANQQSFAETHLATNFTLKDIAGINHQLSNYKGKWVLVNYWATWCPPCLEEVPDLVNLYDHHKNKDLMVIGVVFDYANVKEVESYVDDMLMSYPIVLGDDAVTRKIGVSDVLPTTFFYNPKGQLVKIKRGLITKQFIEGFLNAKKP